MDPTQIREIDAASARERLDQKTAVFIDVRDPDSYRAAHIPGALHVNDHNIQKFLQDTPEDETVVVYCYHGNMSRGGTAYLQSQGFTDVYSLAGGFEGWRTAHPCEPGAP